MEKLSGELQERLAKLNARRDKYEYHGQTLREKTLTRLIAPTAVGKSTIINRILQLAEEQGMDAAEVGTVTTRPRRQSDPANYITADEGITHESMIEQIEKGELVSWSLFDTGHLYATAYESFPGEYNFLPCLPDSLPMQDKAGFRATKTFYIVTSAEAWFEQMKERRGPGFSGRLEEALNSLEFSDSATDLHKIVCLLGDEELASTALRILNFSKHHDLKTQNVFDDPYASISPLRDDDFEQYHTDMYNMALQLIHEEDDAAQ